MGLGDMFEGGVSLDDISLLIILLVTFLFFLFYFRVCIHLSKNSPLGDKIIYNLSGVASICAMIIFTWIFISNII